MAKEVPWPDEIYVVQDDYGDDEMALTVIPKGANAISEFHDRHGETIGVYKLVSVQRIRVHVGLDRVTQKG